MSKKKNKYDVFISYRWVEPDMSWVRNELVPRLKNAGLAVCLDVEDFVPGRDLITEMDRAGNESRHVLCIISPDYFDGDRFVTFESLLARRADPAGRNSNLIPLIFRKTTLPTWINGIIPIDWINNDYHEREWKKLLRCIRNEHALKSRNGIKISRKNSISLSKILVIGSAHLDILADYRTDYAKYVDKIGTMKLTLGGSAYNMAVNLGQNYYNVSLFTYLKKDSLSAKLIKEAINFNKIDDSYVYSIDSMQESGYVALRLEKDIVSAVSSINIDKVAFNINHLTTAISNNNIIVLECNLNTLQLTQAIDISIKQNKRVFISVVSESKINRAIEALTNFNNTVCEVIFMNLLEAKEIFGDVQIINDVKTIISMCEKIRCKNVVVTRGKHGYIIFTNEGNRYDYPAPETGIIISELGAGDALMSAICAHASTSDTINWERCKQLIHAYVLPILGVDEATIGATKLPQFI